MNIFKKLIKPTHYDTAHVFIMSLELVFFFMSIIFVLHGIFTINTAVANIMGLFYGLGCGFTIYAWQSSYKGKGDGETVR